MARERCSPSRLRAREATGHVRDRWAGTESDEMEDRWTPCGRKTLVDGFEHAGRRWKSEDHWGQKGRLFDGWTCLKEDE